MLTAFLTALLVVDSCNAFTKFWHLIKQKQKIDCIGLSLVLVVVIVVYCLINKKRKVFQNIWPTTGETRNVTKSEDKQLWFKSVLRHCNCMKRFRSPVFKIHPIPQHRRILPVRETIYDWGLDTNFQKMHTSAI